MSRWLRNVNALLENLDSQVEETVEEHRFSCNQSGGSIGGEDNGLVDEDAVGVDDILAKRGLLVEEEEEDVVFGEEVGGAVVEDAGIENSMNEERAVLQDSRDNTPAVTTVNSGEGINHNKISDATNNGEGDEKPKEQHSTSEPTDASEGEKEEVTDTSSSSLDHTSSKSERTMPISATESNEGQQVIPTVTPKDIPSVEVAPPPPPTANTANPATLKELRKLRRHVLQLNSDLESSEREIEAQRLELDRAAARMERDRSRHKQEKESHDASHKAEIAALTSAHERALQQLKESNESTLAEMEGRVMRAEQQRAQEGGERDADLAEALNRERDAIATTSKLHEEKKTMNERITSLTTEISRLEARLEHATSQMELASERERNAEEQLDKALSVHYRQLGVRQKRESELEQTVADLGAALVVAKTKVEAAMKAGINLDGGGRSESSNNAVEDDPSDLKARLQDSQDEIETLRVQLQLERQRCFTLHNELQDLSKEQADELSGAHARQRQYERKISDLTVLVAKLQTSVRRSASSYGVDPSDNTGISDDFTSTSDVQYSGDEKKETDHLRKQIASLSEKIFDQQSIIDRSNGEISTLKNKLQAAIIRAEAAEKSSEVANQRLIMIDVQGDGGYAHSGMSSADEEMGAAGTKYQRSKRRVPMRSSNTRRGFNKSSKVESIRSALGLHPGRVATGGCQDTMAQILDTFDALAIDLGSHFRHYPISRLAFMAYLVLLHVWAFFLLVFHAHAQGTVGGDHYSPESMFRSYGHVEQTPKVNTP